jgi:hypothetical protein
MHECKMLTEHDMKNAKAKLDHRYAHLYAQLITEDPDSRVDSEFWKLDRQHAYITRLTPQQMLDDVYFTKGQFDVLMECMNPSYLPNACSIRFRSFVDHYDGLLTEPWFGLIKKYISCADAECKEAQLSRNVSRISPS